jgi:hypothetical protein
VATGASSGQFQYTGKLLYWANPVYWKANLYTKVIIDIGTASWPDVRVAIQGAQDGDRLICSFIASQTGQAQTIEFPGVDIGAASVMARCNAEAAADSRFGLYYTVGDIIWADCIFFFLKTRGQLYLSRVLWKTPPTDTLYPI